MDEKIDQTQVERFKEIARMMECNEDEARFAVRLRKVAGQKPSPEGSTSGRD